MEQDMYIGVQTSIKKEEEPRYKNIRDRFKGLYSSTPQFFARAPGRVNIIGEHIDYCGYAVLPAALEQDFVMAYTLNDSQNITINNIDKDKFPQEVIPADPHQKFKDDNHWVNYFLCGMKAIFSIEPELSASVTSFKGISILIDSQVPPASGLSSSSAFTVCAAILMLHVYDLRDKIPKDKLCNLCIEAERKAGTACGGMDQTISIMGENGKAKLIEFNPSIKATNVEIPSNVLLVIANSLAPSPKLATLYKRYNMRVVECRLALIILSVKILKLDSPSLVQFKTFYELQQSLNEQFDKMIEHSMTYLKKGGYTVDQIKKELNIGDVYPLVKDIAYSQEVLQHNACFYLGERALHVFSEAKRVYDYKQICNDENLAQDEKAKQLGKLMNDSHESCHKLYDCSSPELEELTQMCRGNGAFGCRLTGAGWGGCCVSLIRREDKDQFIYKIQDYYLKKREPGEQLWVTDDLNRYLFATEPAKGASGTSSYLRYIQKFRNTASSKLTSEDSSFNKENQSIESCTDRTNTSDHKIYKRGISQVKDKPIKVYGLPYEDKRTTVDTKDHYNLNQTFSYNEREDQSSSLMQKELKNQIQNMQKRLDKEEDTNRETIKLLKLLQQQNNCSEDETKQNRIDLENLSSRIFIIEQKLENQISLKDLQEKPRALMDKDIKELGREMAMDIIKLSKKLESKDQANQKRLESLEQDMKKTKERLYKVLEDERKRQQKMKSLENKTIEQQAKVVEEKRHSANESYTNILKKLESLSKEVHMHAKRPSNKQSEKYLTTDTDQDYQKKENKIMYRINQLESDLEKIKSNAYLTGNSNNNNLVSLSADFGTLSPQHDSLVRRCPSFSKNNFDSYSIPPKDKRNLSKSAQRLQNSLEKRMSDNDCSQNKQSKHDQSRVKKESRKPYRDVMNISFSSSSSDFYYQTGKSQNDISCIIPKVVKSGRSKSRSKSKNRSTAKKACSAHRRSYDDLIRVEVKKRNCTQGHTRKGSNNRDINLSEFARKKEFEMIERAKRMVNLASLSMIQKEIRRRSCSSSLRKKGPSRKRSEQNKGNLLLQNIKQNLLRPGLPQTLKEPIVRRSMNNSTKKGKFGRTLI